MRKVGEGGFKVLAQARKATKHELSIYHNKHIKIKCKTCGVEMVKSEKQIKTFGADINCYTCFKAGEEEVKQAMINLAKNKGLIK